MTKRKESKRKRGKEEGEGEGGRRGGEKEREEREYKSVCHRGRGRGRGVGGRDTGEIGDSGKCTLVKGWVLEHPMTEIYHEQVCDCVSCGDSIFFKQDFTGKF